MKKRVFRNVLGLALAAVMTVSAAMPALAARGPDTAYETLAESHVTQATLPEGQWCPSRTGAAMWMTPW